MNPVLAEVYRNDVVESCHRGSVLVVNTTGETVLSIGDVDRDIYPRSSLKFFQAIPLIESGAADHYSLSDKEIAMACASHNAERIHVDTVSQWLNRLGLSIEDLECGPDLPLSISAIRHLYTNAEEPKRVHQNCSGKHAGMLTLARFLNEKTKGYSEHGHAAQQAWMQSMSELLDINVGQLKWERDGCGMPAIVMPMRKLAYGCSLFANPGVVGGSRAKAMSRIISAVQSEPMMLAGSERCCTAVIKQTRGAIVVKTGAEAVYVAVIPHLGLGLALKIDDGATRASEVALGGVLRKLGALDQSTYDNLGGFFEPAIVNSQGKTTGKIKPGEILTAVDD